MITLHTLDSDAAKAQFLAARTNTRRFADAAAAFSAEIGTDDDEGHIAALIADALRGDSLSALTGRAPAAPVRHLPSMSRGVRAVVAEIQGIDIDDVPSMCPILAADGVTPTDAQAHRVRNGRTNVDVRATSERCAYCLAGDVVRTLRRDAVRDADARWNRRGA